MSLFLFVLYAALLAGLISQWRFLRASGLSWKVLTSIFLVKIAAGILYGWFYSRIPNHEVNSDTWNYFYHSLESTRALKQDPVNWFRSIFQHSYTNNQGLFSSGGSLWNDLPEEIMIRWMAVCNLFSGGHYYTNVIFFAFTGLVGTIAWCRFLQEKFSLNILQGAWITTLLPSFLFWGSGFHKEGLLFTLLAFMIYAYHKILADRLTAKRLLVVLFCAFFLFLIRNYFLLAFLPLLILWPVNERNKSPWKNMAVFLLASLLAIVVFSNLASGVNVPGLIADRQAAFMELEGNSRIYMPVIEPEWISLLRATPYALFNSFFQPLLFQSQKPQEWISGIETVFYVLLFLLSLYFLFKNDTIKSCLREPALTFFLPLLLGCVLYLVVIGWTVPFSGAIVRYRSILLPLLITPIGQLLFKRIHIK